MEGRAGRTDGWIQSLMDVQLLMLLVVAFLFMLLLLWDILMGVWRVGVFPGIVVCRKRMKLKWKGSGWGL